MKNRDAARWIVTGCAVLATGKYLGIGEKICRTSKGAFDKLKGYFKKAEDTAEEVIEEVKEEITTSDKD
jgi:hypothetical protein